MTTEQFAYWLQGFSEIHGAPPSAEQWEMIKEHLQTCFVKVTSDTTTKIPRLTITHPENKNIDDFLNELNKRQYGSDHLPMTITC